MLIDGAGLSAGTKLRSTVVVIGAGPAGLTTAMELAQARVPVMVIDAGGRHHRRRDDERLRGEVAKGAGDEPVQFVRSRQRGFGGTSGHWQPDTGLRLRPLDHIDFERHSARPDSWWPIGREELDPYYTEMTARLDVPAGYGEVDDPDVSSGLVWPGGPQLAVFRIAEHDVVVDTYDEVVGMDALTLALDLSCLRFESDEDGGRVTAVHCVGPEGQPVSIEGETFVVACGGIDSARLMLASPGRTGSGLGNETDNVGRYYQDHLAIDTGVMVPAPGRRIDPHPYTRTRDTPTSRQQPMLWLGDDRLRELGLLNAAFWLNPVEPLYRTPGVSALRRLRAGWHCTPRSMRGEDVATALRDLPSLARFAGRRLARSSRSDAAADLWLRVITEQQPDRSSRITLADDTDETGLRRARIAWKVSEGDLQLVRDHQDAISALLEERGVGRIDERFDPGEQIAPVMPMYHHIGTLRMHTDPEHGVVDTHLRVHSTTNLYATGSAVFPTGSYVNPTLTLMALSLRLGRHLVAQQKPTTINEA